MQPMQRQCAWCLRLINDDGEPISARSLPKLYEATHGICCECGEQWLEEMMDEDSENNESSYGRRGKLSARELLAHLSLSSSSTALVFR